MPQLTFPTASDGLFVGVLVNLDAASLVPLRQSGRPAPPPLRARGLIDTGSDITAVALPLLQQLNVAASHQTTTQGVGGIVQVSLFTVSLHIVDFQNLGGPWFTHPRLLVMDLATGLPFDAVIGLDIILGCKLVVDGPGGQFTLDF